MESMDRAVDRTSAARADALRDRRLASCFAQREAHHKLRTGAHTAASPLHLTAVQLDQPLNQGQADAQSTLRELGGSFHLGKHVEYIRQRIGRNSDAGISNHNQRLLTLPLDAEANTA